jgi:hypothetical protein
MEHRVRHDVGRDLAKKATVAAFATYKHKYGDYSPTTTWTSDYTATVTFAIKGFTMDGKILIEEKDVVMDMHVPFLLKPFRKRALDVIEREIQLWCQKAKAGELDR